MKTTYNGTPIVKVIFIKNDPYGAKHRKGDIVEAYWFEYDGRGCYYEWGVDNHGFGKDLAISIAEWRDLQIDEILK